MSIKTKKIWQVATPATVDVAQVFADYHPVVAQLLLGRGINSSEDARMFFHASYAHDSGDPYLFKEMEAATCLVIDKIKAEESIVIYGDYDADGVTSASVLYETLKLLKAKVSIYIPDRVSEGYGMNIEAIRQLASLGSKLVITVDNGIRSKAEVAEAKRLGMEVIVTDHHVAPDLADLPECLIINPMMVNESYPYKFLAGVGVAAKFSVGIIRKTKLDEALKLRLEERILDLVAIGTVADCVRLTGENRLLVKKGLEVMNLHKRLGLRELFKVAKLNTNKTIDAWNLGFQIAPRLNAAGRLEHANTAFELLTSSDEREAERLANSLNDSNLERQKITEEIVNYIANNVVPKIEDEKIIIAVNPEGVLWNEGVVGLVAGRITERNQLPTLVISGANGEYKGSGRSIESFNLISALEECQETLFKFGGHKAACGFSIHGQENFEAFCLKLKRIAKNRLAETNLQSTLKIDAELKFSDITEELMNRITDFAPFGEGNLRPIFVSRSLEIVDLTKMGAESQHLKLKLRQNDSQFLSAITFNVQDKWPDLKIGAKIDLAYYLDINDFNGRREIQLRIIDLEIL